MVEDKGPLHPSLPFLGLFSSQAHNARSVAVPAGGTRLPRPREKGTNGEKGINEPKHGRVVIIISGIRWLVDVAKMRHRENHCYLALRQNKVFQPIFLLRAPDFYHGSSGEK